MTSEEWAAELAELGAAFKRVGRMPSAPLPSPLPPLKGPGVFPKLVEAGLVHDYEERLPPSDWRDELIPPLGANETDKQGETA